MYYPDEVIEEVRSRNDIVDVISAYVKLQKKGSSWFGLCPFHNEKSPSFSVSPSKQMYYCFGCGAGGNVIGFIMQYENYTFPEAVRFLGERAGMALPEEEYSAEKKKEQDLKSQLLEINKAAGVYYYYQLRDPSGRQGMDYLKNRGLSDETIRQFGLGYAGKYSDGLYRYLKSKNYPDELLSQTGLVSVDEKKGMHDKFWNRVMFPIMDVNQKIIGFGGRVMGDAKPKYLNSPETKIFDKSRNLYGLYIAKRTREPFLIVCEGYMDVISMHQAGFTNAVASLGTALTEQHCALLRRYTDQVILSYDSDGAGVKAALRAIPMVRRAGISARVLHLDPYKDPDEFIRNMGAEQFRERLEHAENSFMFEVSAAEAGFDLTDPEGKTRFYREAARMISRFEQDVERENYIEAVAAKYNIRTESLRKLVIQYLKTGGTDNNEREKQDRPQRHSSAPKDSGIAKSEQLLLTWLTEYPSIYPVLKEFIRPEDFSVQLHQEAAALLYAQLEKGELSPAAVIDRFEDPEDQKKAARLFNSTVHTETKEDLVKAIRETIRKVFTEAQQRKRQGAEGPDLDELVQLRERKKKLDRIDRVQIVITE